MSHLVVEARAASIEEGMAPKEATLRANAGSFGAGGCYSIILSAVSSPRCSFQGLPDGLYQQFAVTIAISVLISAFKR